MAPEKNQWIIPPSGDHAIRGGRPRSHSESHARIRSKDSFERSGVQCAWVGPGSQMRFGLQVHEGWAF